VSIVGVSDIKAVPESDVEIVFRGCAPEIKFCVTVHGYLLVYGPPWPRAWRSERARVLHIVYDGATSLCPIEEFLTSGQPVEVVLQQNDLKNVATGYVCMVSREQDGFVHAEIRTELGKWL
jgi:hypothetical protein